MYPCPSGHFQDAQKACTCSHQTVTRYQKRISGPMLDRIDIHIEVPRVDFEKFLINEREKVQKIFALEWEVRAKNKAKDTLSWRMGL